MRPLQDIAVLLVIVVTLPICVLWPWVASVGWGWLSFIFPRRLANAISFDVHLGWVVTAAILTGVAARGKRYRLPRSPEMYLMLALWVFCGVTTAFAAIHPERAWPRFFQLSKTLSIMLVVMSLSMDRRKLTQLMWITALSLAAYALIGATWVVLTGGAQPLYGPRTSDIENNNDLAPALAAVAPFFIFLGRGAEPAWVRHGSLVLFGVMIVAILGTYSRAAVLALGVMMILLAVFRQWRALAAAAVAMVVFLLCTAPSAWVARVDSIRSYQADQSASMRPNEWYVALRLGLDHPLLGAGFHPFSEDIYERYIPGYTDYHEAHNHFLQVFAEHGFPGLFLYVALIGTTLFKLARRAWGPDAWGRDQARMLLIGTIAYIVDGMFHCLSYRDIFFELLTLSMMVDSLAKATGAAAAGPSSAFRSIDNGPR